MPVRRPAGSRWEVVLAVPADLGDFGLHHEEEVAVAAFRRRLAAAYGDRHATRVGSDVEPEFRRARAGLVDRPVLWSGFLMLTSPAGPDHELPAAGRPDGLTRPGRTGELAATAFGLFIWVQVTITELPPPPRDVPVSPEDFLARTLKARYGPGAHVHVVSYDGTPAVATVRPVEVDVAGTTVGSVSFRSEAPPLVQHHAEVSLLFFEQEALVTVTAATADGAALDDAVLLAGSIARTVRVRTRSAAPVRADSPALSVWLGDGRELAVGTTLLGRAPRPRAGEHADALLAVADESVSKTHLTVQLDPGRAVVIDRGSTNGTVVHHRDGREQPLRPHEPQEVGEGAVVVLGVTTLHVGRAVGDLEHTVLRR